MRKLLALFFALIALTLPASALDLPDGLDGAVPGELLESAEKGDDLMVRGAAFLWETLRAALGETLASSLRAAVALMLLALLCGLADGTAAGAGETAVRFVPYAGVIGAAGLAAGDMHSLIGLGLETLDELAAMAKLLLPTMAAAMAGGGMVGTASVWQVGALMLSDLFLSLIRDLLVPVLYCVIAAAAAGALLPESGLTPLAEGAKKLLGWALGAVLTAFVAFLSLSGILAALPTAWRCAWEKRSSPARCRSSAGSCPKRRRRCSRRRACFAARSACWAFSRCSRSALRRWCSWGGSIFSTVRRRFSAAWWGRKR